MNILIVGMGGVGLHYLELLRKFKDINNIYTIDIVKFPNKSIKQINLKSIIQKKLKLILQ